MQQATNAQLLTWLQQHEAMYQRFLTLPDGEYDGISEIGYDNDGRSMITEDKLAGLKPQHGCRHCGELSKIGRTGAVRLSTAVP